MDSTTNGDREEMNHPGIGKQNRNIVVQIDRKLQDLIPGYLNARRDDVQKLRRAIADKDYETTRLLGHSMKGSGGGYGFEKITEIGRQIEAAAKKQDLEESRKLTEAFKRYLDCITVVYD